MRKIREVLLHNFTENGPGAPVSNDIAIVKLIRPLVFNERFVKAASLKPKDYVPPGIL